MSVSVMCLSFRHRARRQVCHFVHFVNTIGGNKKCKFSQFLIIFTVLKWITLVFKCGRNVYDVLNLF